MSRAVELRVSAPGKLYLFGEYAVLAGGWAMVAAVDRRVHAVRYAEPGNYRALGLGDELVLPRAVLHEIRASTTGEVCALGRLGTDVREMRENGTNLGLGSSAASAVALAAVALGSGRREIETETFRRRVLSIAERAHASFQGGLGSGGAIAAAVFGGVSACRRLRPTAEFSAIERTLDLEETVTEGAFSCAGVGVPGEVELRAVWLGREASTPDFVDSVLERAQSTPSDVYRRLQKIAEAAEKGIRAAQGSAGARFIDAIGEADRAMTELGAFCEIPIIIDRHRRLREVAQAHGFAAKPSGAGGGDFSLVAGPSEGDWSAFDRALPDELSLFEIDFGAEGVRSAQ